MTDPTRADWDTLVAHNKALIDRNVALRQQAEAARALAANYQEMYEHNLTVMSEASACLTEARAQAAAAWEAGRDALRDRMWRMAGSHKEAGAVFDDNARLMEAARALTPPADASAALTARLDAERRACATECEMCPDENWGQWMAARIMARCSDKGGCA